MLFLTNAKIFGGHRMLPLLNIVSGSVSSASGWEKSEKLFVVYSKEAQRFAISFAPALNEQLS